MSSPTKISKQDKSTGLRTAQYARNALGFYPMTLDDADKFAIITTKVVEWLKSNKVHASNAKENFEAIGKYVYDDLSYFISDLTSLNDHAAQSLGYATVYSCIARFEAYKSSKKGDKRN